ATAADVDGAAELSEKSALRLPGDAVGETTLHLQALVALHPGIDRGENVARSPRNRSRRGRESGAGDLGDESALLRNVDTRSLFRQRLVEHRRTQADFISDFEELTLGDEIARFGHGAGAL